MDIEQAKELLGLEYSFTADFTNAVIQELALPKEAKILDIGTGAGNLAITLAINGYQVLTGEPESDDSQYANRDWLDNAEKVGVADQIKFKPFEAQDLPFDDNTFDAIFLLGSFHHIESSDRTRALQECLRTARDEAVVCIFEPNAAGMEIIKQVIPSHPDPADPADYAQDMGLSPEKKPGPFFDAFIFRIGGVS